MLLNYICGLLCSSQHDHRRPSLSPPLITFVVDSCARLSHIAKPSKKVSMHSTSPGELFSGRGNRFFTSFNETAHVGSSCFILFFCSIHSFFILVFLPSSSHHSHCKQARLIVSIHLPPERQNDRRERSQPRRDCRLIDSMLLSQVFFFWKYLLFSHRNLQFPCRRSAAKRKNAQAKIGFRLLFFSLLFSLSSCAAAGRSSKSSSLHQKKKRRRKKKENVQVCLLFSVFCLMSAQLDFTSFRLSPTPLVSIVLSCYFRSISSERNLRAQILFGFSSKN